MNKNIENYWSQMENKITSIKKHALSIKLSHTKTIKENLETN